jgi:hypothetical protein
MWKKGVNSTIEKERVWGWVGRRSRLTAGCVVVEGWLKVDESEKAVDGVVDEVVDEGCWPRLWMKVVDESGRRGLPMMEKHEEGRKMCSGGGAGDDWRTWCGSAKKLQ